MKKIGQYVVLGSLFLGSVVSDLVSLSAFDSPKVYAEEITDKTIPWVNELSLRLTQDGTLHIPGGTVTGEIDSHNYNKISLYSYVFSENIKKIIIDAPLIIKGDASMLFSTLLTVTTIEGLEKLDTSQVTNMSGMFSNLKALTSLDVSHFDTSQVTNMSGMFSNLNTLTSLDVSHFNTSQVTNMSDMFANMEALTSLDVSHFDTSQVTNMSGMFGGYGNSIPEYPQPYGAGLSTLDVSSFDTSKVESIFAMFMNMKNIQALDLSNFNLEQVDDSFGTWALFFGDESLQTLTLGKGFKFIEPTSPTFYNFPSLSPIPVTPGYTRKWQNIGSGSVLSPKGEHVWTSDEFIANYNGKTDAETYVWQPLITAGKDVTVKYVDEVGKALSKDWVLSGNVGEYYTTEQKEIAGYTFKEVQGQASGTFTDQAQTVTYVYTKNEESQPEVEGIVLTKYLDEDGNEIATRNQSSGPIGTEYRTLQKEIVGYIFKEVQGQAMGTYSEGTKTVTYVYTKNTKNNTSVLKPINPVHPDTPIKSGRELPNPSSSTLNNMLSKGTIHKIHLKNFSKPLSNSAILPQTGDYKESSTLLTLVGLVFLGLLGFLLGLKKHKMKY
ncbi:MucBP domain-containing protein [Lactococcus garvieae]|uniref:MucBP domain-containing protein n=1 Tax=Lactococcus garvieae TaxID=1363 RepID=UPI003852923D